MKEFLLSEDGLLEKVEYRKVTQYYARWGMCAEVVGVMEVMQGRGVGVHAGNVVDACIAASWYPSSPEHSASQRRFASLDTYTNSVLHSWGGSLLNAHTIPDQSATSPYHWRDTAVHRKVVLNRFISAGVDSKKIIPFLSAAAPTESLCADITKASNDTSNSLVPRLHGAIVNGDGVHGVATMLDTIRASLGKVDPHCTTLLLKQLLISTDASQSSRQRLLHLEEVMHQGSSFCTLPPTGLILLAHYVRRAYKECHEKVGFDVHSIAFYAAVASVEGRVGAAPPGSDVAELLAMFSVLETVVSEVVKKTAPVHPYVFRCVLDVGRMRGDAAEQQVRNWMEAQKYHPKDVEFIEGPDFVVAGVPYERFDPLRVAYAVLPMDDLVGKVVA